MGLWGCVCVCLFVNQPLHHASLARVSFMCMETAVRTVFPQIVCTSGSVRLLRILKSSPFPSHVAPLVCLVFHKALDPPLFND